MMWGSWGDPRARATRGFRRPSLDARSWDHSSHPFVKVVSERSLRPCLRNGASWRGGVGRVKTAVILSILRECVSDFWRLLIEDIKGGFYATNRVPYGGL